MIPSLQFMTHFFEKKRKITLSCHNYPLYNSYGKIEACRKQAEESFRSVAQLYLHSKFSFLLDLQVTDLLTQLLALQFTTSVSIIVDMTHKICCVIITSNLFYTLMCQIIHSIIQEKHIVLSGYSYKSKHK